MRCPKCGEAAELLKKPCCEDAWSDHVVDHPNEAVAALQRGDYGGAAKAATEQLAVAFAVITAADLASGASHLSEFLVSGRGIAQVTSAGPVEARLVAKLRASIGRTAGSVVSRDEQHTVMAVLRVKLDWRTRLRALWRGRLAIETSVMTERLPGRASWSCRVVG